MIYRDENRYDSIILQAAGLSSVPAALIKSVLANESGFNPLVVSSAGAMGIAQIMPATARSLGYGGPLGDKSTGDGLFDPRVAIPLSAKYLAQLMRRYNGNIEATLSGYNAGHSMIPAAGPQAIPNAENREYVRKGVIHYNYFTGALSLENAVAALRSGLWMKIAVIGAGAIGLLLIAGIGLLLFAVWRR